jgi:hypothetical protein
MGGLRSLRRKIEEAQKGKMKWVVVRASGKKPQKIKVRIKENSKGEKEVTEVIKKA